MRLIDADALKIELDAWARIIQNPDHYLRADALHIIDTAPEISATPVVHGRWLRDEDDDKYCSECGQYGRPEYGMYTYIESDYCPNCGAKMEVEHEAD